MKRIFTYLFVVVLMMLGTASWAQTTLEVGSVYHFQNAHFTGRAITALESSATAVQATATNPADVKQLWLVSQDENGKYIFRNIFNGNYLSQTLQNTWVLSETNTANSNKFEYIVAGGTNNTIRSAAVTNTNGYMHLGSDAQTNIQGWGSGSGGSQWTVTKIDITPEIDDLLSQFVNSTEEQIREALSVIFGEDGSCTILTSTYANMTEQQLLADASYKILPKVFRDMVKKVHSGNWEEANAIETKESWGSDYAKKFRVQMYEPYSIENEITSYLRINAHCNMDNPTGIYANNGETIYIMVGGDIPEGAELWVAHQAGLGATNGYNNSAYTRLQKGLNIIPYTADASTLWINYVVHTYNSNGATIAEKFPENRKLSKYKPLKIHIEGGHINGFFNAIGDFRAADSGTEDLWGAVDNDEDWNYYKVRAPLNGTDAPNRDFPLLGHRQTLLFPLGQQANADGGMEQGLLYHLDNITVPTAPNCYAGSGTGFGNYSDTYYPGMGLSATNGKINIMIEAWDRIMYSELASMGVVSKSTMDRMNTLYPRWTSEGTPAEIYDFNNASSLDGKTYQEFCQGIDYSEYFNHHGCGVGAGSGYMSGGWRVCNYHYNTMGSIIGAIANEAGPTWGPAHEIGHQHQLVFNLNGQTEVTNNFFSNVAVWYMGMGTSRVNGSEGSLESVLNAFNTEGNDLYTNNIWAIAHLYYRLWLYYHLAGNNTQFWPRLFELCRREPIVNGGQISGDNSLLLFYKHACNAAGEDLTEFFRAHGFFEIMDNRVVGDYSNATYNVTQEQIDEAIAEIKEKQYPVNYAVLFINDGTAETTLKHDGATSRSLWDNNPTAEFGSVNDFIAGDTEISAAYTANMNADGTISMEGGEGGVGFLILNENGEIISFSNKSTFALSEEAKIDIMSGKVTVLSVDSESNSETAVVELVDVKKSLLGSLIAEVQPIVNMVDDTYTKIGYYKGAAVAALAAALEQAIEIYENGAGYQAAYSTLLTEYNKLKENENAKIPFDAELTYIITNYAYSAQTMWVNSENTVRSEGSIDQASNDARWVFEETTTAGVYKIHTLNNDYIPAVRQSASMTATTGQADSDALYTLEEVKDGVWAIKLSPAEGYRNLHSSGNNVVGWETGADASRWYLTAVEKSATIEGLTEIEVLVNKTEMLINEVSAGITITKGAALQLQTGDERSNYYLWSNAPETREGDIANLVDGGTNNYFHTDWSSQPVSGTHYIAVDLGASNTIERFTFSHTTRPGVQNDFPKAVEVYGSNDNVNYYLISSASGMPQSAGTYWELEGEMSCVPYRYLRFNYHANRGYWHMAEFDIYPVTGSAAAVKDIYSTVITSDALTSAYDKMQAGKALINSHAPEADDVLAKQEALQDAYDALYAQYESILRDRKNTLAGLVGETSTLLGEVAETLIISQTTHLTLTASNLYCNEVKTNDCGTGGDTSATGYVANLTDGNTDTFLHTNYNGSSQAVNPPHYLRVDLGENSIVTQFIFNYTTRNNGNNCPTTILVEGCNEADGEYTEIKTLTTADGLPNGSALEFKSSVIKANAAYRYIRFKVTGVEGGGATFFVMSEFGFATVVTDVAVKDHYAEAVSEELLLSTYFVNEASNLLCTSSIVASIETLDAQIVELQAAKAALEEAKNLVAINKEALQSLYDAAVALYDKMTGGELDYTPSALTPELLAEAKTTIDAAKAQLDAQTTTQGAIDAAKDALQEKYDALLAIEEANVASRDELTDVINNVKILLGTIATEGEYKAAISLQAANDANDFYVKLSAVGDGNVANMLDKNADGSANIDTYVGSAWGSGLADYTHYVQVDLGAVYSMNSLLFDYTTRNSGHDTERPTAIKVLGSNDGTDYTEITIIEEGLATGAGEQWTMEEPLTLAADYRYIRLAVKSGVNSFHMSDFNIYAIVPYILDEYYDTAEGLNFNTLCFALQQAEKLAGRYLTEAQYTAICEKLTACYTAAQGVVDAGYAGERESLATLIASAKTILGTIADADEEQTPVAYTIKEYYTTAEGLGFDALCLALQQAEAVSEKYVTADQYSTICSALESASTTAQGIIDNDVANRDALATLITNANVLITEIATEVESPKLSTANVYCNADNSTNSGAGSGDKQGVAALFDGKVSTHLHTTYGNNSQDDDLHHYIRVDLGEASAFTAFRFSYKGREANNDNAPTDMLVQVCNTPDGEWVTIKTLTGLPISGASPVSYESELIEMGGVYRYVRFMVTDTQNHSTTTYNEVSHKFFVMSEFRLEARTSVVVKDEYSTIDSALARDLYNKKNAAANATAHYMTESEYNATLAGLQASYDNIVAPLKETLQAQVEPLQALYDKMATDNGDVEAYYSSVLTAEVLAAAGEALSVAQGLLADGAAVTVTAIVGAKSALEEQEALLQGIDDADVADREELTERIATMQGLLGETTSSITTGAVALQATNAENDFYIWCNAPAGDSQGVAGLIDKNDDGSANTGTFLGTDWGATVEAYTHYLEIDLGASAIEDLSIDYTTRDSENFGNQRPNGLKISGSNDKEIYEEITTITEGLPTGQCEKWTMPTPVALTTGYRYIRIAVSTEVGYFNMSDFNLYSSSIATVNENYSTSEIFACLPAVLSAYSTAKNAASSYVTATDYEAAKTALQEQIEALNAIKNANVIDKSELTDLIAETNELIAEVADIDDTETVLALQATDANAPYYIYCNAPGASNNYDGDNLGTSALLDADDNGEPVTATFLHTTYTGDSHDDELDHYLRVDMGESNLLSFKFRYTPRIGNTDNAPLVMLIEGSNDCVNFEKITTLTDMATTYQSGEITNGKAYRYIRFMVKKTHNNAKYEGHPFFAMSHFEMTACKTIAVKEEFASPNLPLAKVVAAKNEAVDAGVIENQFYVTQQAYEATLASLQAAKYALEVAKASKDMPVLITTDANNPILYKIKINRDGDKRLQYDEASSMVAVADVALNAYQAWYFMLGDNAATNDLLILPYKGEGKVLATNSFSEGNSKVKLVEKGTEGYSYNWNIAAIENSDWSNITIPDGNGTTFYFSNHGGPSHNMGFYNHYDDGGSQFKFILDETDYSLPEHYYTLYNQHQACGGEKTEGNKIGQYKETTEYNAAYSAATAILENKTLTNEEYEAAYNTLKAAYEALELNVPQAGTLYHIRSAYTGQYSDGKKVYVDAENKPYFAELADESQPNYVWQFEEVNGGYNLKNLQTQTYVTAASGHVTMGETGAKLITMDVLDANNAIVRLNVSGGSPLHAQESGSKLVGWDGGLNSASAWYIEEVTDTDNVTHPTTVNSAGVGSIMLGYTATIPEGIEAFYPKAYSEKFVTLAPYDGVLPANTAAILKVKDGYDPAATYNFTYNSSAVADDETTAPGKATAADGVVIAGSLYTKLVDVTTHDAEMGDVNFYMFLSTKNNSKLYWVYENYLADGTSTGNNDDGDYIKVNANRAYIALAKPVAQNLSSFSLRFDYEWGTTEIEDVETENTGVDTIFDLQGRKLNEITEPGFYIVNGVKVFVK